MKKPDYDTVDQLVAAGLGAEYITIDIAHGHADSVKNMIAHLKKKLPKTFVIAGNVGTPEAVIDLENWGADATKVGIGPGKVCITKLKTGFGTGGWQLSALKWCARVATKPIIADGGIRDHGDIAKSIRFGASMVMIGSLFAGHEESPGKTVEVDGALFKEYYGSASDFNKGEYKHVEGKRILEPIKGKLADTLLEMEQDMQSSISYAGGTQADGHPQGQLRHPGRRQRGRTPADVSPRHDDPLRSFSRPCLLRRARRLRRRLAHHRAGAPSPRQRHHRPGLARPLRDGDAGRRRRDARDGERLRQRRQGHLLARRAHDRRRDGGDDEHDDCAQGAPDRHRLVERRRLWAQVLGDEEGDPSSGFAKVRIFNTANGDVGPVDVYFVAGGCASLATSGAAAFASNVTGLQSAFGQIATSSTPVHVCITSPGDRSDARLDIPAVTLSEKRIVTIVLVLTSGGFFLNGLVLDQQGTLTAAANGSARVRVATSLAAPATQPPVEGNGTDRPRRRPADAERRPVPDRGRGRQLIKINGTTVTPPAPLTAAAGADVTLLLTGAAPTVTLIADDNAVSSSTGRPVKIRLVNGLNGSTGPATPTVDNAPVGNGASSPGASAYSLVPASAALARIEARSGVIQLYLANNVTLTSGRVYSLFLLGDVASAPNTGVLIADR